MDEPNNHDPKQEPSSGAGEDEGSSSKDGNEEHLKEDQKPLNR